MNDAIFPILPDNRSMKYITTVVVPTSTATPQGCALIYTVFSCSSGTSYRYSVCSVSMVASVLSGRMTSISFTG